MAEGYKPKTGTFSLVDIMEKIEMVNRGIGGVQPGNVTMVAKSAYKPKEKKSYTESIYF
jgi:hypothetical protein